MRHRKSGVKLNRTTSHRNAMFRNMVTSLFKHNRIRTTDAKAKELRRLAENLVTLAKRGDLHARRQALAIINEKKVVHRLFEDAPKRFSTSMGGYTRIVKIGRRAGDAAPMSIIEFVAPPLKTSAKPTKSVTQNTEKQKEAKAADSKAEDAQEAPSDDEAAS